MRREREWVCVRVDLSVDKVEKNENETGERRVRAGGVKERGE